VRIGVLRLLRCICKAEPEYAFEKAKAFQKDENPAVASELLALFADLLPRYFQESLSIVRRSLSHDPSQPLEPRIGVMNALQLLSRAMPHYPDMVFEVTADHLREYFGEHDLKLEFGENLLDQAFKLLGDYALIQPQTNVRRIIGLLEERFKSRWSKVMKPDVPYDGMEGFGMILGQEGFGPPTLHEDSMVTVSLITPLLALAKHKPESALEFAQSLADDPNAFARRSALHVALDLSLKSNSTADRLIEKAFDIYINSHEYLSVFQTAESCLIPLAARRPSFTMDLLRKLRSAGVEYLDHFEIAALLDLAEANDDAKAMLVEVLKNGTAHVVPQVIKGTERLVKSDPELVESVLNLAVERFREDAPWDVVSTVVSAAATLAKTSWSRAKPAFEVAVRSSRWIHESNVAQRLAEIAKVNPDARAEAIQMLEKLSHDSSSTTRQGALWAAAELRELEGRFGLDLLESLSNDPSPAPEEDKQLLDAPVGRPLVIKTVRGVVAWTIPYFVQVDKGRCWSLLSRLSADNSAYVRTMAIRSLEFWSKEPSHLDDVMAILLAGGPKATGLLGDESAWVRHGSLRLMFYQLADNPKSTDAFYSLVRNALKDNDSAVRSEAAQRVLDAVAFRRDSRYQELLQEVAEHGTTEERSDIAFRIRSYMEKDEKGAFELFKPILARLVSDPERNVRERAALSLESWAEAHPGDVAGWCCLLTEAEACSSGDTFLSMTGYHISQAFRRLVSSHPAEAVTVLECIERLPDKHHLNQILDAAKDLSPEFRPRVQGIADRLLKKGLPSAQKLLDYWSKAGTEAA
jgi:hypothetical protein